MRRSWWGVVAALVILSGCGGDPKADPSPSPSTSPVSTTPSPTAPVMPAAASENTKAGAIAFVRYYIDTQNFAAESGNTEELARLSLSTCEECRSVVDRIRRTYAAGGKIEGDGWIARSVVTLEGAPGPTDLKYVVAKLKISPQTIYERPSASPSTFAGNRHLLMTFGLKWGSTWQLAEMKVDGQ